ncbi:ChaB family protein, partial [Cronobacter sakazakii]
MPYSSRTDLPDNVRNVLPAHAQDIYKEAFN